MTQLSVKQGLGVTEIVADNTAVAVFRSAALADVREITPKTPRSFIRQAGCPFAPRDLSAVRKNKREEIEIHYNRTVPALIRTPRCRGVEGPSPSLLEPSRKLGCPQCTSLHTGFNALRSIVELVSNTLRCISRELRTRTHRQITKKAKSKIEAPVSSAFLLDWARLGRPKASA